MKNALVIRRHNDDGIKFPVGTVVTGMPDNKFSDFVHAALVREATAQEVAEAGVGAIAFTTFRDQPEEAPAKLRAPRKPRKRHPCSKAKPAAQPAAVS